MSTKTDTTTTQGGGLSEFEKVQIRANELRLKIDLLSIQLDDTPLTEDPLTWAKLNGARAELKFVERWLRREGAFDSIVDSLWTVKEAMLYSFEQAAAQGEPPPTRAEREALAEINRELDAYGVPRVRPEGA